MNSSNNQPIHPMDALKHRRKRRRKKKREEPVLSIPQEEESFNKGSGGIAQLFVLLSVVSLGVGLLVSQVVFGGYGMLIFSLPTHFFTALAAILGGVAVLIKGQFNLRLSCLFLGGLLATYVYWRIFTGESRDFAVQASFLFTTYLLIYLLMGVYHRPSTRLILVGIFIFATLLQSGIALIQVLEHANYSPMAFLSVRYKQWLGDGVSFRAIGLHVNPNALAWTLNAGVIFSIALAWWGRFGLKLRILLYYTGFVCLAMSIFAVSRGGVLSLATGIFVLLAFGMIALVRATRRQGVRVLLVGAGLSFCLFFIVWMIYSSNPFIQERFEGLFEDSNRIQATEFAYRIFLDHPVIGVGPGGYFYGSRPMRGSEWWDFAHNDWAQLLAEYGWIGFSLAFLFIIFHLWKGFGRCRQLMVGKLAGSATGKSTQFGLALASVAFLCAALVHSYFDFNTQITANGFLFAMVLGIVAFSRKSIQGGRFSASILGGVLILFGVGVFWVFPSYIQSEWHWLKADNAMGNGDYMEATQFARRGLEANTENARLWYLQAMGERRFAENISDMDESLRLAERAITSFETAYMLEPQEYLFLLDSMPLLNLLGKSQEEEQNFEQLVKLVPFHGPIFIAYARHWESQGNLPQAVYFYRLATRMRDGQSARAQLKILEPILKRQETERRKNP